MVRVTRSQRSWALRAMRVATMTLLATGCSASATGPNRPAPTLSVTKTSVGYTLPLPIPQIVTTSSSVAVTEILATATPCYSVSATDRIDELTLTIRLVAKSSNVPCIQMLGVSQYTVTSVEVPFYVAHLRLEQAGFTAGTPAVLLDTDIRGI